MGVFKKLSGNNVRVTPLQVKKRQEVTLNPITGKNFNTVERPADSTQFSGSKTESTALVYNSIRHLYYSNFITPGYLQFSGSIFTDATKSVAVNDPGIAFGPFYNSPQSSLPETKILPVGFEKEIKVYSIPVKTFGESIVPGTLSSSILLDKNADGVIISESDDSYYGNVFYDNGIIIVTGKGGDGTTFGDLGSGLTASFSSSFTIYATEYICTAGPNEFNYSLNPTLRSTDVEYNSSIINSPEFMPYVTTVGLYNENQELMAVGKLGQPVQLNPHTHTNFIKKLDR